jgi:acetyl/propionyl-CoA carboxylase alpha subunit
MLWIAAGKALPSRLLLNGGKAGYLEPKGWAIESRIYAEDPLRNFLPSIGPLVTYKEPVCKTSEMDNENGEKVTVRVDTGVREGDSISMYYDPMIAKLCTHSSTRQGAIKAMERALDEYFISGLVNNIPFCRSIFRNEAFRSGNYGTSFIGQQYPHGFKGLELTESESYEFVGLVAAIHQARKSMKIQDRSSSSLSNDNNYEEENFDQEIVICVSDNNHAVKPTVETFHVTSSFEDEVLEVKINDTKASSSSSSKVMITII